MKMIKTKNKKNRFNCIFYRYIKRMLLFALPLGLMVLPSVAAPNPDDIQTDSKEPSIIETVQVENIEVPVRVFDGKGMVKGLTKDDFRLYVNGKRIAINGFYTVCNKLGVTSTSNSKNESPQQNDPRLFVLIFNLSDANQELTSAMDLFFGSVIQPNDRLMIISNHFFVSEWVVQDPATAKKKTMDIVARQKNKLRPEMSWFRNELSAMATVLKSRLADPDEREHDDQFPASIFDEFFLNYRFVLEDMKSQYLSLPVSRYIRIANYLKSQRIKKWVFNFYQIGQMPMLGTSGQVGRAYEQYANLSGAGSPGGGPGSSGFVPKASAAAQRIRSQFNQLQNDILSYDDVLNKDIGKAFLNSGATFHTMLLKPLNPTFSQDYDYQSVSTDTEVILRHLSRVTGGSIMKTNDMKKFIKDFTQREDILYMLTYVPDQEHSRSKKGKHPKVEVKLNNNNNKNIYQKYRVVFDDQKRQYTFRSAERRLNQADPDIEIEKVVYKDEVLTVKLKNIKMVEFQGEIYGAVRARIKIMDSESLVLDDFEKTFKGINETGVFKVKLPELRNGRYQVVLEIKDQFSLKNTVSGEAVSIVK